MIANGRASRPLGQIQQVSLRVALAASLTGYLLWRSRPADVVAATVNADWRPMAIAVALVLLDRALMAYRWVALLCTIEAPQRPRLGALMRIFFVSTFVGTFLPASVGSDVLRTYSLSKLGVNPADAVASVVMDRVLGIGSILIMGVVGLVLSRDLGMSSSVVLALAAAAIACLAAALLVFRRPIDHAGEQASYATPLETLRGVVGGIMESIRKYAGYPRVLVNVLLCSVGVQCLRIVQAYFLGRGLGLDLSIATYFAFIPVILLVMLLPVTFNGIGTSQAAFVWFFGRAGVPAAPAFALSVLFVALGIVGNLPGATLYISGGKRPPD